MKIIRAKMIKRTLRNLGFFPASGRGTGHEYWQDVSGREVKPVFRKKEIHYRTAFCLAVQLEGLGVCEKRTFFQMIRGNS